MPKAAREDASGVSIETSDFLTERIPTPRGIEIDQIVQRGAIRDADGAKVVRGMGRTNTATRGILGGWCADRSTLPLQAA
jgi:hypothetical protein